MKVGGARTTTIVAWAWIAIVLSLLVSFSSSQASVIIRVSEQTPILGTAGQTVIENPYSADSEVVILNDTPSLSPAKWTISRNGYGYLDEAHRSTIVVSTNLTELTCSATLQVGKGGLWAFIYFDWFESNRKDARHIGHEGGDAINVGEGHTESWTTELNINDVRNQTSSGAVSLRISIDTSIPVHFSKDSGPLEILGFSLVGTYNTTLSPVAFHVQAADGDAIFIPGDPARQHLGDIDLNITNREMLIPFMITVSDSNMSLLLPPGNYTGVCFWDTGHADGNTSIDAVVYSNSTVQWSIKLPSARIHLDLSPEIPNYRLCVQTTYAGVCSDIGPVDILLAPGAEVLIIAFVYFNPAGFPDASRTETALTLEGAVVVTVVMETSYLVFGPLGLLPIMSFLIANLCLPILFVIITKRHELTTRRLFDISTRPGVPSFLILVLSLLLPWPTNWATIPFSLQVTIPFIMQNLWWTQQPLVVVTATPFSDLTSCCLLWVAAAITSTALDKDKRARFHVGLCFAAASIVLSFWSAVVFRPSILPLYWFLGPLAVIAAIVMPFAIGHLVRRRMSEAGQET